jgi:hypothetical protein
VGSLVRPLTTHVVFACGASWLVLPGE